MVCKSNRYDNSRLVSRSFILTKWFVNKYSKCIIWHKFNSFILTKWFVNQNRERVFVVSILGFILTKWFVNCLIYINYKRKVRVLY